MHCCDIIITQMMQCSCSFLFVFLVLTTCQIFRVEANVRNANMGVTVTIVTVTLVILQRTENVNLQTRNWNMIIAFPRKEGRRETKQLSTVTHQIASEHVELEQVVAIQRVSDRDDKIKRQRIENQSLMIIIMQKHNNNKDIPQSSNEETWTAGQISSH